MAVIADHIRDVTRIGGDLTAIDLDGRKVSWAEIGRLSDTLKGLLDRSGFGPEAVVGLLGRNGIEQVASFVALLGADRATLLVNALRPVGLVAEELAEIRLAALVCAKEDLKDEIIAAGSASGTMIIGVALAGSDLVAEVLLGARPGQFRQRSEGTLIEIQTSGTTGKPKRIPLSEQIVGASLRDGVRKAAGTVDQAVITPKSSPTLMFGPLVHTSGTFNTLMSVFEARPIVLFEKFDAEKFRQMLRTYRPKFAPLPPSAIKMMVDSEATREDFESVIAVRAGTAPLPVDLQVAFEEKFGVPVLTTYGATEFMGTVASWTLDDHRRFGVSKRGSVGRPSTGVQVRIVDPATGEPADPDVMGILEAKLDRIDGGRSWIRTTDLARVDGDGFIYIVGRADDAIIRGGFKVMAGKVSDTLLQCPGVHDVIVLGRPDERLGEVPVAVVEPYPGRADVSEAALRAFAKSKLVPYEVPARFFVVEKLPRTVSDKISRPEVKAYLDRVETETV